MSLYNYLASEDRPTEVSGTTTSREKKKKITAPPVVQTAAERVIQWSFEQLKWLQETISIDDELKGWQVCQVTNVVSGLSQGLFLEREAFSDESFFRMFPNCKRIIVEPAHLVPRTEKSKAQLFSDEELLKFYNSCEIRGIEVWLYPNKLTPGAIQEFVGLPLPGKDVETKKAFGAWAACAILCDSAWYENRRSCLMRWKPVLSDWESARVFHRKQIRQEITMRINRARAVGNYNNPDCVRASLVYNIIDGYYPSGPNHPQIKEWFDTPTQYYSIYCAVFGPDGKLRKINERFIGIRELEYILRCSAYHGKAGVARSNLMWWGLKPKEKTAGLTNKELYNSSLTNTSEGRRRRCQEFRQPQRKARRALMQAMRTIGELEEGTLTVVPSWLQRYINTNGNGGTNSIGRIHTMVR